MLSTAQKIAVHLISKKRSFRVSILTLFLSLFTFSFVCVLSFIYSRDYQSILNFSKAVADETTAIIRARIGAISKDAEIVTRLIAGFIPSTGPLDTSNTIIQHYLLSLIKHDPNCSNIYVGFPNGTMVSGISLEQLTSLCFITKPQVPLPKETRFILRFVDARSSPPTDTWHYLNAEFEELASEVISPSPFNPLVRPWYKGAIQTGQLFWSGLYTFYPFPEIGISVSNPLFQNGKLAAVIGADLSFHVLSQFLAEQKIGTSGQAFLLDSSGRIIVPEAASLAPHASEQVAVAYQHFLHHPLKPEFIFEYQGVKYLSFLTNVSDLFGQSWGILAIAPLSEFLSSIIKTQDEILLFILAIILLSTLIVVYFSKKIASPIVVLANEINKLKDLDLKSKIRVRSDVTEIALLDNALDAMRRVVTSFSKYVPKEIVKQLFDLNQEISLGGEKKEMTVFFSDVSNFTQVAELQPIDQLFPLLTSYFDAMSKIILHQNGTIDKFIGDGIMAFWGAPIEEPHHAEKACDAALLCHAMLTSFNAARKRESLPEFPTRFGIHSGAVIVGNVGTHDRLNYTVIGDAVNTTARLQEVDKAYHTSIVISEETHSRLGPRYTTRPLDQVTVKGKIHPIKIYELLGKLEGEEAIRPSPSQIELCERFSSAYTLMEQGRPQEALTLFSSLAETFPDDYPTQIYLKRLQKKGGNP